MSKKSVIWRVVLGIVIVAALAAAGYGVYLWGYRSGAVVTCMGEGDIPGMFGFPRAFGRFGFFEGKDEDWGMHKPFRGHGDFTPGEDDDLSMPFHRGFYDRDRFSRSRTFFSPFSIVIRLVVFGVFLWLIYKVITVLARGKGWQFSFRSIEDGDKKDKKK